MEAAKILIPGLNPKIVVHRQNVDVHIPLKGRSHFLQMTTYRAKTSSGRACPKRFSAVCAVSSGIQDIEVSSSQFQDFSVTASDTGNANELKISMKISGAKTQAVFDAVFTKMVADAQPIPGFRRVKGGKTPNIPRDILLEVLGPSRVYKQVVKKAINSTIAEYVEKEALKVSKNLRVEQSIEDLEAAFEPGESFSFDAVIQLQGSN